MSRLVPFLAIVLLAGLIGCGGSGGDGGTGSMTGTTTGGTSGGGTSDLRPITGAYTVSLAGSNGTTTYAGTGTGTVTASGVVSLTYGSVPAGSNVATSHTLAVTVTAAGVATGSLTTGTVTLPATGTGVRNADGTYLLTIKTVDGTVTETDKFTLTSVYPPSGTYKGQNNGTTDDQGGTYTGAATVIVADGGNFSAAVTSSRRLGGATTTLGQTIPSGTGKFAADGTFTATLNQGSGVTSTSTLITDGKWTLTNKVLTLKFKFENPNYNGASGHPNTTEILTVAAQ